MIPFYDADFKKPAGRLPQAFISTNPFILDLDSGPYYATKDEPEQKGREECGRCSVSTLFKLTIFCSILTILFCLGLFVFASVECRAFPMADASDVCASPECRATSRLFSSTMNYDADPCEDFYEFACGNWNWTAKSYVDHTTLIKERLVDTLRDLMGRIAVGSETSSSVKEMKKFYDSCVRYNPTSEDLNTVINFVNDLIQGNDSLGTTLGKIRKVTGQSYMFKLYIGPDLKNTSTRRIFVDKPELALPKQILLGPSLMQEYSHLLFNGIEKFVPFIVHDSKRPTKKKLSLEDTILKILEFETKLAEAMTNEEDKTKPGMYNLVTLGHLNEIFTERQELENPMLEGVEKQPVHLKLNWTEYMSITFENVSSVTDDTVIDVIDFQYIRGLAAVIAKSSHHRLQMYLRWQMLRAFGNKVLQHQQISYHHNVGTGKKSSATRVKEEECIQLIGTLLPFALSHTYVRNKTGLPVIQEAKKILKDVVLSFQDMVIQSNWMEPETKFKAIQKAGSVKAFLGYPKWVMNLTQLDTYHHGLVLGDNFFKNLILILHWSSHKNLKSYEQAVDTQWSGIGDSPEDVDAFYDDELNAITIPSGFLQPPFVGMGLRSVDYGALGYFIGHELIHGFDTEGRYSDENGRLSSWWTAQTLENFDTKTHCIEDQYNRFYIPSINKSVNGKQTLKENIADISGLEQAFRAYHLYLAREGEEELTLPGFNHFTPEQLFFLSFAQSWCSYVSSTTLRDMVESNEHAPPKFRVLGSLANSKSFSAVWNCSAGSAMNPARKCSLW